MGGFKSDTQLFRNISTGYSPPPTAMGGVFILRLYGLHQRVDIIVLRPRWGALLRSGRWLHTIHEMTDIAVLIEDKVWSLATLHRNDGSVHKRDIVVERRHVRVCPSDTVA